MYATAHWAERKSREFCAETKSKRRNKKEHAVSNARTLGIEQNETSENAYLAFPIVLSILYQLAVAIILVLSSSIHCNRTADVYANSYFRCGKIAIVFGVI